MNDLKKFKDVLKILASKLNIKWALIGSTNLAIQGMDVNPRDLDIVVMFEDLEKVRVLLKDYHPDPIKKLEVMTNEPAWEVKLYINDVEVQILGELKHGEYVSKRMANEIIYVDEIPCFTLDAEARAYSETNRKEKADKIWEFIKKR